jgi:hypothetical protein
MSIVAQSRESLISALLWHDPLLYQNHWTDYLTTHFRCTSIVKIKSSLALPLPI